MTDTTLYYFFSTISQVLAAISALLAVFTQFKISEIKDFLIGDGKATYERMKLKEQGYKLDKKHEDRLRDSLGRKSILGIYEVIILLSKNEKDEGKSLLSNPKGLQFLENGFSNRMNQITEIKSLTKKSLIFAFISIIVSVISLIFVQTLYNTCIVNWIIFAVVFTTSSSMIFTTLGIYKGLQDQEDI